MQQFVDLGGEKMQLSDNQYKFFNKLIPSSNELFEDKPGHLFF